jgi:hypothetical protein
MRKRPPSEERLAPEAFRAALPAGLAAALAGLGAEAEQGWREADRLYGTAASPDGPLFVRLSRSPDDVAVFAHEARVHRLVGADGALRSPPVLAEGPGWLVLRRIGSEPFAGAEAVALAVEAAMRIPALELPVAPPGPNGRPPLVRRLTAVVRSPVPLRDLVRARRLLSDPGLPDAGSHGDYHPGNLLLSEGTLWVVDWELTGSRPWGYDLMRLHATVERDEDREEILARALELAGPRRDALLRLAYALAVKTIADKLHGDRSFDRDEAGASRLLALLPELRRQAGL